MKKCIFPILISILLFYPSQGFAEVKEIVSEGTYNMGDGETPSVAESRALLQAKQIALEQAGTYVVSYAKIKNFQLSEDEIQVLASGLMEVEILDKKRTVVGNGIHFWVKIKAKVNLDKTEDLANRIKAKDKTFVEDYKKIQEAYGKSQKDIEELKKELAEAKGAKERKQVEAKITDAERLFEAVLWFEKAEIHVNNLEYNKAIDAYTSSIALNPNNARAYNGRGLVYTFLRRYDEAIDDYNKMMTLVPLSDVFDVLFLLAYDGRKFAYELKGIQYYTIENLNRIIALNPTAVDYQDRGLIYLNDGRYKEAIDDLNKAIAMHPHFPKAYVSRGEAYYYAGQYEIAIEDFNKALTMNANIAEAYFGRGLAYQKSNNVEKAISDFQKACDIGSEDGCKELQKVLKNEQ